MKKLINNPENFISEMLEGYYAANAGMAACVGGDPRCLVTPAKIPGKVGLATGGGSGHLPLFMGYVGAGMLDGCAVGDVFQSPSPGQILAVTREIDAGSGVLYIYGNYNGDIFNFDMAAEMAGFEEDIRVESVVVGEDVSSPAPSPGEKNTRRGVAGLFFVYKCAGAAAAEMLPLEEVKRIAEKTRDNTRTIGVALSPCIVPRVGRPGFTIQEDEMELGMGIHGEPGICRCKLATADDVADAMLERLIPDIPFKSGDEVAVLVNGLGATPLEEQYIVARRVNEALRQKGISPARFYVGEFATALEMSGLSVSLLRLDSELSRLLKRPADTPLFKQFQLE